MMESSNYSNGSNLTDHPMQIIRHPSYSLPWLDIRVFYVRISGFPVDDSTPEHLTLNHSPLGPDTVLEVNGARCSMDSQQMFMSCILKRDRVDKKSEEATFVTTDSIRITDSVKFQVFDKEDLVISGGLEMSSANGFITNAHKKWTMKCETVDSAGVGFLRGKQIPGSKSFVSPPTIEVYVAGCSSGAPVVLTKTLQISSPYKKHRKGTSTVTGMLHSIPEYDVAESQEGAAFRHDLQVAEYKNYIVECDDDYDNLYWRRTQYMEDEDGGEEGELSWFNAGVGLGVGISLGFCLGVGIGVGLLVRSYHTTRGTIKRHFL